MKVYQWLAFDNALPMDAKDRLLVYDKMLNTSNLSPTYDRATNFMVAPVDLALVQCGLNHVSVTFRFYIIVQYSSALSIQVFTFLQ